MEQSKAYYLKQKFQKELSKLQPNESANINRKIDEASDEAFDALNCLNMKSTTATLLLSIFLGSLCIGRFYLGDWLFAIVKIIITVAVNIISVFVTPMGTFGLILNLLFMLGILIWYIVEIVMCYKRCNLLNYNKLVNCLNAF